MTKYLIKRITAFCVVMVVGISSQLFSQTVSYDSVLAMNDEFYSFYPMSNGNLIYDTATGNLQLAYLLREESTPRLYWATSTDGGATWATSSPLDNGKGTENTASDVSLRQDLETSADQTPFLVWVESRFATRRAIFFTRDEGYNLGLWRAPVLLNDTTGAVVSNPNLAVSNDGDTILVTWEGDGNIWFTRSTDGGTSFEPSSMIIDKTNPVFPDLGENQSLGIPTIALGSNGYVFLMAAYSISGIVDFGGPGYGTGPVYITSADYGANWSSATIIEAPAGFHPEGGLAVGHVPKSHGGVGSGSVVLSNNFPHITWVWKQVAADGVTSDQSSVRVFEGHADAQENWTWVQISRDHDPCAMISTQGGFNTIGADNNGGIYVLFADHYPEDAPSRWGPLYIRASNDGGQTWSEIMPVVTDHDFRIWTPEIARSVSNDVYWAGLKGGPWVAAPSTALVVGEVPTDMIFSYVAPPPPEDTTTLNTLGYGLLSSTTGAISFDWVEIKEIGTLLTDDQWVDPNTDGTPNFAKDDGAAGPIPIGFPFYFLGETVDSVWVGANGGMSFAGFSQFYPGSIPGANIDKLVAVFWRDQYLRDAYGSGTGKGEVYYWLNAASDTFIVEWYQNGTTFPVTEGDTLATYQAILSRNDSSITLQYLGAGPAGTADNAVVGIQLESGGNTGLAYFSGCPLDNKPFPGLAVRFTPSGITAVSDASELATLPNRFELYQNYPNPFNPATTITYSIPKEAEVTLKIYNVLGVAVRTLVEGKQRAGYHTVTWDGKNDKGIVVGSGVYFCRLESVSGTSSDFIDMRKMISIK